MANVDNILHVLTGALREIERGSINRRPGHVDYHENRTKDEIGEIARAALLAYQAVRNYHEGEARRKFLELAELLGYRVEPIAAARHSEAERAVPEHPLEVGEFARSSL